MRISYLRFAEVRSLNLVFYLVVFGSFNLFGLSYIFGFLLGYIFSFLNRYIFGFLYGHLFLYSVVYSSGYIFFLVLNSLVVSHNFFFGYSFVNFFFYGLVLNFLYGDLFLNSFFNLFVFDFFSFIRNIFNS